MSHKIILLLLASFFLWGCDKPNPEPEKLDPIYEELQKEAASMNSQVAAAEKELEGFKKDLEAVVPQTGQIKYAQKRVYEAEAKLTKLKQLKDYWEMRVESRLKWDREHYLKAYNAKQPWPDPKEYEEFKAQLALERAPKQWDLKQRMEQAKLGMKLKGSGEHGEGGEGAASDHGEAPKEERGSEH